MAPKLHRACPKHEPTCLTTAPSWRGCRIALGLVRFVALLLALTTIPVRASAPAPKLHTSAIVKYDDVRDLTTVTVPRMQLRSNLYLLLSYSHPGKASARPAVVSFVLRASRMVVDYDPHTPRNTAPAELKWERVKNVFFRYGDKRMSFPAAYDTLVVKKGANFFRASYGGLYTDERLTVSLPPDVLASMVEAKNLKFEVDDTGDTSDIKGPSLRAFRDILSTMPAAG